MNRSEILMAIAPITPVYFGDGRPNDAGEADYGSSRFPPSPRTLQGLARTALLRSVEGLSLGKDADRSRIESLVGPPERLPDGWQFAGPWPAAWQEQEDGTASGVEPWLPCPGWLGSDRAGGLSFREWREIGGRGKGDDSGVRTDLSEKSMAGLLVGKGGFLRRWIGPTDALRVIEGDLPTSVPPLLPPFVEREPHTGLQLDPSRRAAEEGMLYTLDYFRFRTTSGLAARFQGPIHPPLTAAALSAGVSNLGRKNRVARLLRVADWCPSFSRILTGKHIPDRIEDGARFWIWATTPVRAQDPLSPGMERIEHRGARLRLLSAAIGHPEPIGGFSLARGRSAVSRRYLPGGSAWLVEATGGDTTSRRDLLMKIHDVCCLGDDPAEQSFGFGHALVANIPKTWRNR